MLDARQQTLVVCVHAVLYRALLKMAEYEVGSPLPIFNKFHLHAEMEGSKYHHGLLLWMIASLSCDVINRHSYK